MDVSLKNSQSGWAVGREECPWDKAEAPWDSRSRGCGSHSRCGKARRVAGKLGAAAAGSDGRCPASPGRRRDMRLPPPRPAHVDSSVLSGNRLRLVGVEKYSCSLGARLSHGLLSPSVRSKSSSCPMKLKLGEMLDFFLLTKS